MFSSNKTFRKRWNYFPLSLPKRMPRRLFDWARMTSNNQYDLVDDDEYDIKIPLHPEEAFHCGISFHAKYIGTLDVPRPASRVEIVTAMRRVRYEFKCSGVKKRKVTMDVSVDGVRVTARKKITQTKKGARLFGTRYVNSGPVEIMHHPIYRIFYVSHDSSDLKIFSYIARDNATNVFKCNVFKSNKKSQAMRIVRTVGQAFEVCHKLALNREPQPGTSASSFVEEITTSDKATEITSSKEAVSELGAVSNGPPSTKAAGDDGALAIVEAKPQRPQHLELLPPPPKTNRKRSPMRGTTVPVVGNLIDFPECETKVFPECETKVELPPIMPSPQLTLSATPLSDKHEMLLLRESLEQQVQQTQAAVAQLLLLRNQLAAEQAARCEAQNRTHQLLMHNKDLLEHIAALVSHLQDHERGSSEATLNAQHLTLLPQIMHSGTPIRSNDNAAASVNELSPEEDGFLEIMRRTTITNQNIKNNNIVTPRLDASNKISFKGMTNKQIQDYLIARFENLELNPENKLQIKKEEVKKDEVNKVEAKKEEVKREEPKDLIDMTPNNNQVFVRKLSNSDIKLNFTNRNLPDNPFDNEEFEFSLKDFESQNSMLSLSDSDSSNESSDSEDGVSFIKPLSHKGTLAAKGEDGKVRLIVPVSPSNSSTHVAQVHAPAQDASGNTLRVPDDGSVPSTSQGITRSTSERVPNRSEMMAAMRSQWTRHTTK